jgi:hypothetical protein
MQNPTAIKINEQANVTGNNFKNSTQLPLPSPTKFEFSVQLLVPHFFFKHPKISPIQFLEYDSDSDSAYPVHHHNTPPFQTRAGTMADATHFLEYDSDSDNLVQHHNKPPLTSENNWLLKYQQLF